MSTHTIDTLRTADADLQRAVTVEEAQPVLLHVIAVLREAFSDDDPFVLGMQSVTLPNRELGTVNPGRYARRLQSTIMTTRALIERAIQRLEARATQDLPMDVTTTDPDLWEYVGNLITNGDWAHVGSAACRFLEHQVRSWAGATSEADAPGLVAGLFGRGADLALGDNEGQRQGWESIIRGMLMGPRNAVQHGIDGRHPDELRRFAAGVVGAATMILTEIRSRHPQRFEQPTEPPDTDA